MVHFDTHYPPTPQTSLLPSPLLTRRHLSLLSCVLIFQEFHPPWYDQSETVWWKLYIITLSLCNFHHSLVTYSLSHLHTNITLSSLFLNILKLRADFTTIQKQTQLEFCSLTVLYKKKMGRKNILNCQKQVFYLMEMKWKKWDKAWQGKEQQFYR